MPEVVAEHGAYPKIFHGMMQKSLPDEWDFTMDAYDVVTKMEYPSEEKIDEYDAFMYTGSGKCMETEAKDSGSIIIAAASAYAYLEWIHKLVAFTAHLAQDHPKVKLLGICFGHQIISLAFGGACVKNDGKWEIGPTKLRLTDLGESIFGVRNELVSSEKMQYRCIHESSP